MIDGSDVLTVKEAAELLRLHPNTVYDLVARKKIPARKIGSVIRISRLRLESWIRGE